MDCIWLKFVVNPLQKIGEIGSELVKHVSVFQNSFYNSLFSYIRPCSYQEIHDFAIKCGNTGQSQAKSSSRWFSFHVLLTKFLFAISMTMFEEQIKMDGNNEFAQDCIVAAEEAVKVSEIQKTFTRAFETSYLELLENAKEYSLLCNQFIIVTEARVNVAITQAECERLAGQLRNMSRLYSDLLDKQNDLKQQVSHIRINAEEGLAD